MKLRTLVMATVVLATSFAAAAANAATIRTPAIVPGAEQMLVCTVVNLGEKPLAIAAEIVDRWGDNVTCFARTDWDTTETTLRTVHLEATNPNARWCRVTVKGGRKTDVAVTLQACRFDLRVCTSPVVGR